MAKHHRIIWYITGAVVAITVVILGVRSTVEAPAVYEPLVPAMLDSLAKDPLALKDDTRLSVARVASLAESGQLQTAEAYYALGLHLRRQVDGLEGEKARRSEAAYRKAIELRPDWSWPYNGLGILLHSLKRYDEAEACFRAAIVREPDWSRPHNDLAIMLRISGRYDEAEKEARRAIELEPDGLAANNNYANLLVALERYEEAKHYYERAREIAPEHPAPYYNLACLACMTGHQEEALPLLEQAIAIDPRYSRQAAVDDDLAPLRLDSRFKAIVDKPPFGGSESP